MNFKNLFWYFDGALSNKLCDEVIKYGESKQDQIAITGNQTAKIAKGPLSEEDILDLKKKRNSNIVWLDERWIYNEIHPYVHIANKSAGWNFQWDFSEACQFTKYKLNQYYNWHCDSNEIPYKEDSNLDYRGKIRKLSMSCLLSDPSDYEGGDFLFQDRGHDDIQEVELPPGLKKGSIIIFPSYVWHKVKPVTKGKRYSLVVWHLGKPFI
tara:strand:+ start:286 stop:915 length:630 start_codon:yes stop_codon:yes gene_type:complete